jgi:hypothetical protein
MTLWTNAVFYQTFLDLQNYGKNDGHVGFFIRTIRDIMHSLA